MYVGQVQQKSVSEKDLQHCDLFPLKCLLSYMKKSTAFWAYIVFLPGTNRIRSQVCVTEETDLVSPTDTIPAYNVIPPRLQEIMSTVQFFNEVNEPHYTNTHGVTHGYTYSVYSYPQILKLHEVCVCVCQHSSCSGLSSPSCNQWLNESQRLSCSTLSAWVCVMFDAPSTEHTHN